MSLIPNTIKAALGLSMLIGAVGCQRSSDKVTRFTTTPIELDEATVYRDAELKVVTYPNGGTAGGSTLYPYEPSDTGAWQILTGTGVFLGQTIIIPVTYFRESGWEPASYQGSIAEPTYTAVPPLTAEDAPADEAPVEPTVDVVDDVEVIVEPAEPVAPDAAPANPQ